ncbi:MAG: hypothetical protein AMJ79_08855 [Phycisphaerae bacterium SM23_30]|nr:MAG: hypothetical protein AMJ79_08855 [Phycisphaerae bacterium SM23_30]
MSVTQHDERVRRCRKLGHEVSFRYCRQELGGLPCGRIIDCWFETFDVENFLCQFYSSEQIRQILAPPPAKLSSIIEMIQQAQERSNNF